MKRDWWPTSRTQLSFSSSPTDKWSSRPCWWRKKKETVRAEMFARLVSKNLLLLCLFHKRTLLRSYVGLLKKRQRERPTFMISMFSWKRLRDGKILVMTLGTSRFLLSSFLRSLRTSHKERRKEIKGSDPGVISRGNGFFFRWPGNHFSFPFSLNALRHLLKRENEREVSGRKKNESANGFQHLLRKERPGAQHYDNKRECPRSYFFSF